MDDNYIKENTLESICYRSAYSISNILDIDDFRNLKLENLDADPYDKKIRRICKYYLISYGMIDSISENEFEEIVKDTKKKFSEFVL